LDNILFEHATKVCQFREKVQVVSLLREHSKVVGVKVKDLSLETEHEFRAHIVVGADGMQSIVARELNVHHLPAEHGCVAVRGYYENIADVKENIELHFVDEMIPGYFWIFPLEGNVCNVGVGMVLSEMQKRKLNLVDEMKKVLQREPFKTRFANAKSLGEIKGWTLPFGSHRRQMAFDGAMLVGDAASLVDPFTGEGIGNALVSGKLAAEVAWNALEKKDYSLAQLKHYETKVWETLGAELDLSYKLQKYSKYKPLLNFAFSKAQSNPKIANALSEMLVNEKPREKLVSPISLVKMLLN
jgi:flavin-dependent dehydrogenase